MAESGQDASAPAQVAARTRALYKKGQKCILPISEKDEEGQDKVVYYAGMIMRGEKRRDPETGEADFYYLVHYIGWNKNFDQWFTEGEIIKYDASLLDGGTSVAADEAVANKKRKAELEAEAIRHQKLLADIPLQLRLRIPAPLKKVVLDDHERVTQKGLALRLPRSKDDKPSVADIIKEWQESRSNEEESAEKEVDQEAVAQVATGLISYFDNALRQFLLYQAEVPLYDAALQGGKLAPSDVYGAEHLLRLFIKLPELVPVVMMCTHGDAQHVLTMEEQVHDLMNSLTDEDRQGVLFAGEEDYEKNEHWVPPPVLSVGLGLGGFGGAAGGGTPGPDSAPAPPVEQTEPEQAQEAAPLQEIEAS